MYGGLSARPYPSSQYKTVEQGTLKLNLFTAIMNNRGSSIQLSETITYLKLDLSCPWTAI